MKLLLTLSLAAMSLTASAQGPATPAGSPAPLPPGPLVKPVPSGVRWTITRKAGPGGALRELEKAEPGAAKDQEKGKEGASRFDIQIIGEKVSDVAHVVTTYGNGNKKEVWKKGGQQTTINTGWKEPIVGPAYDDVEDITWISASNFTGIRKVSDSDCMIFRDKVLPELYRARPDLLRKSVASSDKEQQNIDLITKVLGTESKAIDPESVKIDAFACIDLDSRLPITLQVGKAVTAYKYEALPPNYALNLPADVAAAMEARGQQVKATTRRPVQP